MEKEIITTKSLFSQDNVKARFEKLLGENASGFITSVLQVVNNNKLLAKADPNTVLTAAATAAILKLPINQNLGYAYIVPYNENQKINGQWESRCVAQFQIGYKGLTQLALRSNQYQNINAIPVFENQFKSFNSLTEELEGDFTKEGKGQIVGYAAYFRLTTGFQKTVYWTKETVTRHAKKYSKAFDSKHSWGDIDKFDGMAMKTVLKNALSKYGVLSIEMQTAVQADQSVQLKAGEYNYIDNPDGKDEEGNTERKVMSEDLLNEINDCKTLEELETLWTENKATITKDIVLVSAVGVAKKKLENETT